MSDPAEGNMLPWLSEVCGDCHLLEDSSVDCTRSSATGNIFHAHRLELHDFGKLSDVVQDLITDPSRVAQISAIEVSEFVEAEVEKLEDAEAEPSDVQEPEVSEGRWEEIGLHFATILGKSTQLELFAWKGCDNAGIRPVVFWEALWRTSTTLKRLDLEFYVHELSRLSDTALPRVNFESLTSLSLNATMAHGDTGVMVDQMLHQMPALENLTLYFPTCDLEGCRIQDVTWKYTFPSLRTLSLQTYNSDSKALADFLLRHPDITTLDWSVDADTPFVFPQDSLPNLAAIWLTAQGYPSPIAETLSVLAATPVKHLKINGFSHADYSEIAKLSGTLKCLEISPGSYGWRPDSDSESDDEEEEEGEEVVEKESNTLEAVIADSGSAIVEGKVDAEDKTSVDNKVNDDEKAERQGDKSNDDVVTEGDPTTASDMLPLHKIFKDLLEQLPELTEVALDLDTSNIYVLVGSDTEYSHPDPMTGEDLISALALLPADGHIQALRMYDKLGLSLPIELLASLPRVPLSLEYVSWNTSDGNALYRLEREESLVRAVKCEPLRVTSDKDSWADSRILEY